jgi:hypothetical protein
MLNARLPANLWMNAARGASQALEKRPTVPESLLGEDACCSKA